MHFSNIANFLNTDNNEKLLSDFYKSWQRFLYCQLIQKTMGITCNQQIPTFV
eukprot:Pgem_evm1s14622